MNERFSEILKGGLDYVLKSKTFGILFPFIEIVQNNFSACDFLCKKKEKDFAPKFCKRINLKESRISTDFIRESQKIIVLKSNDQKEFEYEIIEISLLFSFYDCYQIDCFHLELGQLGE